MRRNVSLVHNRKRLLGNFISGFSNFEKNRLISTTYFAKCSGHAFKTFSIDEHNERHNRNIFYFTSIFSLFTYESDQTTVQK